MNKEDHEVKDVDSGRILQFALGLVILLVVTCIVSAIYFFWLGQRERLEMGRILGPLAARMPPYPPPSLEINPGKELQEIRFRESQILSQYRWVNRERGIVAIPIEVAMALLVEKGLPVAGEPGGENGPTWLEMMQERGKEGMP